MGVVFSVATSHSFQVSPASSSHDHVVVPRWSFPLVDGSCCAHFATIPSAYFVASPVVPATQVLNLSISFRMFLWADATYKGFAPHALCICMIACVTAGQLHQPAVPVALVSQSQILPSACLRIPKVIVGHPSHVCVTVQWPQSRLCPLPVDQCLQLVAYTYLIERLEGMNE